MSTEYCQHFQCVREWASVGSPNYWDYMLFLAIRGRTWCCSADLNTARDHKCCHRNKLYTQHFQIQFSTKSSRSRSWALRKFVYVCAKYCCQWICALVLRHTANIQQLMRCHTSISIVSCTCVHDRDWVCAHIWFPHDLSFWCLLLFSLLSAGAVRRHQTGINQTNISQSVLLIGLHGAHHHDRGWSSIIIILYSIYRY